MRYYKESMLLWCVFLIGCADVSKESIQLAEVMVGMFADEADRGQTDAFWFGAGRSRAGQAFVYAFNPPDEDEMVEGIVFTLESIAKSVYANQVNSYKIAFVSAELTWDEGEITDFQIKATNLVVTAALD